MLGLALVLLAAQDVEMVADAPPEIRSSAIRDIDFVPRGWRLYDKAEGDLDNDGQSDAVLIIQKNDPSLMVENPDGLGMDWFDANPRMVLVALQDEAGQYRLVARNGMIVPDHDSPTIDDPFQDLRIENGSVHLDLAFFASAGSWSMFSRRFQFRWDGKAMALIGFESNHVHRGSGEMQQTSVNYLTGKRKDASGSISDDETDWRWSNIAAENRRSWMRSATDLNSKARACPPKKDRL
ncbi:MAG: hypothetical protein HC870_01840 [Rhizobiales bacterium]|nr:hypothetical protein [Hyphomicrobiales bacterium]